METHKYIGELTVTLKLAFITRYGAPPHVYFIDMLVLLPSHVALLSLSFPGAHFQLCLECQLFSIHILVSLICS